MRFLILFLFTNMFSSAFAAPSIPTEILHKSLVYCTNATGFSFNPQKSDINSNVNVVTEQIYDKLLEFNSEKKRFEPALASSYSVSDDGLTITFQLRKNVVFHTTAWFSPTRELNADDVVFSIQRMMGVKTDLPALDREIENSIYHQRQNSIFRKMASRIHTPYFESIELGRKIAKVSAPSPYVVKIELTKPDSSFLAHFASQYAVILSKEYALQLNADDNLVQLDLLPVGTGVYQLKNYERNDYVYLKPNPNYWGKKANIENMIVDFSSDATGRTAKFLNRECDVFAFPEMSQISLMKNANVASNLGANLAYLAFNMQRPIGQNLDLRRRVAQSINRQRIADLLFYGNAHVAENVLPPALWKHNNPAGYPYLPKNEKQSATDRQAVKKDQRFAKIERLNFWVIDERRMYNPHPAKMVELIRADLAKQGISLNIRAVTRAYVVQQLANNQADYDLILSGWQANHLDANSFLAPILSCHTASTSINLSNWCNEEFDYWLETARLSEDQKSRNLLYQMAQKALEEQLPILPLVNVDRVLISDHYVKNVKVSPLGQVKLSDMKLDFTHQDENSGNTRAKKRKTNHNKSGKKGK